MHEDSLGRSADLALVGICTQDQSSYRLIDVDICQKRRRILSAQLQGYPREVCLHGAFPDRDPGRH
ncbi:hypothetical protein D3C78_820210 [compost metagenome]